MPHLPSPTATFAVTAFVREHPCWTAFWDKRLIVGLTKVLVQRSEVNMHVGQVGWIGPCYRPLNRSHTCLFQFVYCRRQGNPSERGDSLCGQYAFHVTGDRPCEQSLRRPAPVGVGLQQVVLVCPTESSRQLRRATRPPFLLQGIVDAPGLIHCDRSDLG